jgi:hypothetical protein
MRVRLRTCGARASLNLTQPAAAHQQNPCRLSIISNSRPITCRLYSSMDSGLGSLQVSPALEGRPIFDLAGVRHGWASALVLVSAGGLLDVPSSPHPPCNRQRHQRHHAANADRHAAWLKSYSIAHHYHLQDAASRARDSFTKETSATSTRCRTSPIGHWTASFICHTLLTYQQHLQTLQLDLPLYLDAFPTRDGSWA